MDIYDYFINIIVWVFLLFLRSVIISLTVCGRGVTVYRWHESINIRKKHEKVILILAQNFLSNLSVELNSIALKK